MRTEQFTRPQPPTPARTGWLTGIITTITLAVVCFMTAANGADAATPEAADQLNRIYLGLVVGSPLIGAIAGTATYAWKRGKLERARRDPEDGEPNRARVTGTSERTGGEP